MTYAFITDGLDQEGKEKIDVALEGAETTKPTQARRERAAFAQLKSIARNQ